MHISKLLLIKVIKSLTCDLKKEWSIPDIKMTLGSLHFLICPSWIKTLFSFGSLQMFYFISKTTLCLLSILLNYLKVSDFFYNIRIRELISSAFLTLLMRLRVIVRLNYSVIIFCFHFRSYFLQIFWFKHFKQSCIHVYSHLYCAH